MASLQEPQDSDCRSPLQPRLLVLKFADTPLARQQISNQRELGKPIYLQLNWTIPSLLVRYPFPLFSCPSFLNLLLHILPSISRPTFRHWSLALSLSRRRLGKQGHFPQKRGASSRLGRMTSREGQFGDAGLVQFTEAFEYHLVILGFGSVINWK